MIRREVWLMDKQDNQDKPDKQQSSSEIVDQVLSGPRWAVILRLSGQLISWVSTIIGFARAMSASKQRWLNMEALAPC